MNRKKILALIMTAVMAVGMSFAVTGCGENESQDEEQVTVEEDAAEPEDTSEVAATVDEIVNLAGEYQDEVSQRATATVIADTESQSLGINIMWSSSAWETTMWTMNATKEGDKLVYNDCTRTELVFSDENADPEETVVYTDKSGSFEISDDGKLLWTGAADPECTECVFVQFTE